MLDKVKCEWCRHTNPPGTELCESCGNQLGEDTGQPLNMRYEGAARRSQTYNKTIIDHIWNFFSSVKVAVWLIAITLVASIFGTIYPQQLYIPSNAIPIDYYTEQYGQLGYYYVVLGLHNMYSSWWYVSLLVMIGISLVICSIDRVVPLYRALSISRVTRHPSFLTRQRVYGKATHDEKSDVLQQAKELLRQKKYKVREEELAVMGEKGRLSRWGPYINHIGLIIFLVGTLMRILPGFYLDEYVWVRDGQTAPVPGTETFYVKSEGFFLETYSDEDFPLLEELEELNSQIPKEFRTEAVLYENQVINETTGETALVEVTRHSIRVNSPLEYEGIKLFQADYILNEFSEFSFAVTRKATGESVGEITVDLTNPDSTYPLQGGYTVELMEYYPDFMVDDNGNPRTRSNVPNNPAFIFKVITPEQPEGERSWVFLGQTVEMPGAENQYVLKFRDVKLNSVSGLMVRKDLSLPVLLTGGMIVMLGLVMGFYWQHRRIWVQQEGKEIWIAAHTNKNWYGITQEVEYIIDQTGLNIDKESLDKEAKAV